MPSSRNYGGEEIVEDKDVMGATIRSDNSEIWENWS